MGGVYLDDFGAEIAKRKIHKKVTYGVVVVLLLLCTNFLNEKNKK